VDLWVLIAVEHGLIVFKYFLSALIPDFPSWVIKTYYYSERCWSNHIRRSRKKSKRTSISWTKWRASQCLLIKLTLRAKRISNHRIRLALCLLLFNWCLELKSFINRNFVYLIVFSCQFPFLFLLFFFFLRLVDVNSIKLSCGFVDTFVKLHSRI
jgi:hypothetical protein